MECLFCKIISGEIPCDTVYEDEQVKVFLDINPNTNGHMLIVPKEHVVTINDINGNLMSHILEVEKKMFSLLKEKLSIDGLTIAQNNDYGQEIKHFHVHLIPRYKNDEWKMNFNKEILKEAKEVFNLIAK